MIMLISGLFWTLTYLLIIRRCAKDRTYGMPIAALCANLSWEFIFAFVLPHGPPQQYVNMIWLGFDLVIFYQFIRYGRETFPRLSGPAFAGFAALSLVTAYCLVLFITLEFANDDRGAYAAFGQNLMMSILFVNLLYRRQDVAGQSLYIALFKMIGTAIASWVFLTERHFGNGYLMPFLYGAIFFFDWVYIILLYRQSQKQGIDPWLRP